MTIEYIFELAKQYENRHKLSISKGLVILDNLENAITAFLRGWALTIPDTQINLFRDRIRRPMEFIINRKFYLDHIWLQANEITVKVTTNRIVEMYICITSNTILIRDKEFGLREIAFPIVW